MFAIFMRRHGAGIALALLAAWPGALAAAELLKGGQIRALVAGNTVQGSMEATGAYTEFYAADGTIRGEGYTGNWTVEGDQMCFQYGSDPKMCWQVAKQGDQLQWIKDGKVDGSGKLVSGNPNKY
ncbi:MAG TPA: hypothetical protein VFE11_03755 [Dongiaceae bacterium]|jgi:hypothetical protein|nr:hypothetical protein [Dongiaceae bacterium]